MESYETASADVKQSIISRTDPETARALCQANRQSREICQNRLSIQDKSRICLKNSKAAAECDLIPMFSQQQFLSLVPKNILMHPDDPIHNTYEFYPQGYKLPTEGFAVALRKAKIMNTICAIIRPDFFLSNSIQRPPLPAYMDAGFLDQVRAGYITAATYKYAHEKSLALGLLLYHVARRERILISVDYDWPTGDINEYNTDAKVDLKDIPSASRRLFFKGMTEDHFLDSVTTFIRATLEDDDDEPHGFPLILATSDETNINVFRLSRIIKIALDQGYHYRCDIGIWAGPELDIKTTL